MGNMCKRCFGKHVDSRKFIRAKCAMTKETSIEFEHLVEEDIQEEILRSTENVSEEVSPFTVTSYMRWLAAQEEALKVDEDFCADRRTVYVQGFPMSLSTESHHSDISIGDRIISSVEKKSACSHLIVDSNNAIYVKSPKSVIDLDGDSAVLSIDANQSNSDALKVSNSLTKVSIPCQSKTGVFSNVLQQRLNSGNGDFQSISSGRDASIDLDWDYEPGMNPFLAEGMERSATEEDLARLSISKENTHGQPTAISGSNDIPALVRCGSHESFVWDHDYTMDISSQYLLTDDT